MPKLGRLTLMPLETRVTDTGWSGSRHRSQPRSHPILLLSLFQTRSGAIGDKYATFRRYAVEGLPQ